MRPALLLSTVAVVATTAVGCAGTPDAADLVSDQAASGPRVSEAAAAAALRDYFGAVNEALDSGDIEDLAAMTGPQCPCRDLVGLLADRFDDDGELVGASFDATDVTVLARENRQAQVRARVSVSEYVVRNADGLRLDRQRPQQYVATYTVRLRDDAWRVVDVRQQR